MQHPTQLTVDVRQVIQTVLALPDDKLARLYDIALQLGASDKNSPSIPGLDNARVANDADSINAEAVMRYMEAKGWITRPTQPVALPSFQPIHIEGEPISEMIIRERR